MMKARKNLFSCIVNIWKLLPKFFHKVAFFHGQQATARFGLENQFCAYAW